MYTVDINGEKYKVKFSYHDDNKIPAYTSKEWEGVSADFWNLADIITKCEILSGDKTKVLAEGRAFCSIRDHFNKPYGRKLAFSRALKNSRFSKEEREAFWEKHFTVTKDKRTVKNHSFL